jgi:hypothetical protein
MGERPSGPDACIQKCDGRSSSATKWWRWRLRTECACRCRSGGAQILCSAIDRGCKPAGRRVARSGWPGAQPDDKRRRRAGQISASVSPESVPDLFPASQESPIWLRFVWSLNRTQLGSLTEWLIETMLIEEIDFNLCINMTIGLRRWGAGVRHDGEGDAVAAEKGFPSLVRSLWSE